MFVSGRRILYHRRHRETTTAGVVRKGFVSLPGFGRESLKSGYLHASPVEKASICFVAPSWFCCGIPAGSGGPTLRSPLKRDALKAVNFFLTQIFHEKLLTYEIPGEKDCRSLHCAYLAHVLLCILLVFCSNKCFVITQSFL